MRILIFKIRNRNYSKNKAETNNTPVGIPYLVILGIGFCSVVIGKYTTPGEDTPLTALTVVF